MDLIITSRMASSRLPGKALKEVVGFGPMLEVLINRAKKSGSVDRVIIATTTLESDDVLVEWANQKSYHTYRGSENNVLGRLIGACDQYKINDFVEILGDNPLVDPDVVCKCVSQYENEYLWFYLCWVCLPNPWPSRGMSRRPMGWPDLGLPILPRCDR